MFYRFWEFQQNGMMKMRMKSWNKFFELVGNSNYNK